ncbi:hypothetical protein E2C01_002827 [Portunus trituberculatus]|uniref:Uncharacterized protein n=1 Tax=Portunus trituberculatus TaxID=210409 RepID=A0A5B7CLS4_PORTR|nr:hypothetical protein [Portunus trituberculatus]
MVSRLNIEMSHSTEEVKDLFIYVFVYMLIGD